MNKTRVTIKPFESKEEVLDYVRMYNDLDERSIYDHLELASPENLLQYFESPNGNNVNLMILNEMGHFIGTIGYRKESDFEYKLGYRILKGMYRSKGYMSETIEVYIPRLFEEHKNLTRLTAQIHEENIPSIRLVKKSGFTYEGTMRKAYQYRDKKVGFQNYSLLREEVYKRKKSDSN